MRKSLVCTTLGLLVCASVVTAAPAEPVSIGKAKTLQTWSEVLIEDAVVTAEQTLVPGSVYVETESRAAGIRIMTMEPLALGTRIKFTGYPLDSTGYPDGRREGLITQTNIFSSTPGKPLAPLGISTRSLAIDQDHILKCGRPSPVGLLVRVWGKMTAAPDKGVFYIDDGAGITDGVFDCKGIRVHLPEDGDYELASAPLVAVTGIFRTEEHLLTKATTINGKLYPAYSVIDVPAIWVRSLDDVTPRPKLLPPLPPASPVAPWEVAWEPAFSTDPSVIELQVLREDYSITETPVRAIRDPWIIGAGRASLANLFGDAPGSLAFNYFKLDANPASSYSIATAVLPRESYGTTHTYQVRAVRKSSGSAGTQYSYAAASAPVSMTVIEPVGLQDIVAPSYDPWYGPTDLCLGDLEDPSLDLFAWDAKPGADIYYVKIEPVIPGTAPSWQSGTIYATRPTVKLTMSDRTRLAAMLSGYPDTVMRWRVYCRHQADTNQAWYEGDESRFVFCAPPPPIPF